jgi:hypothetical protein
MSSIIKVDQIQLADGSTPTAGDLGLNTTGSVLQVVNSNTVAYDTTSSTAYVDTSLTASITPSSTSNKVLISANCFGGKYGADYGVDFRVVDDTGTQIFSIVNGLTDTDSGSNQYNVGASSTYLHSPSRTDTITYTVQFRASTSGTALSNWFFDVQETRSALTLMEIAG